MPQPERTGSDSRDHESMTEREFCPTCQMPRTFQDGRCWKCGTSLDEERANRLAEAPYGPEQRAKWPVPDAIKQASAVDAFMWWAGQGMREFFPLDQPYTEFYNDFTGHTLRCGHLRLTLEWDVKDEPEEPDDAPA